MKSARSRLHGPLPRKLQWVWLGAVAALVVVLVFGFRWAFPPKPSGVSPARPNTVRVDISATPTGWVPYALGDAQISVPSGWLLKGANCGGSGTIGVVYMEGGCPLGIVIPPGGPEEPENWVELDQLSGLDALHVREIAEDADQRGDRLRVSVQQMRDHLYRAIAPFGSDRGRSTPREGPAHPHVLTSSGSTRSRSGSHGPGVMETRVVRGSQRCCAPKLAARVQLLVRRLLDCRQPPESTAKFSSTRA